MASEDPTILTSDLAQPEGPLLLADGTWLVTELDVERGTVTQVRADGSRHPIAKTGRPNGLAQSADGAVWVAESLEPSVIRLELTGELTRELDRVEGEPLLWPNDLCVGPDGAIYATDSGILVGDFLGDDGPREDCKELPVDGRVLRFDPVSREARFVDRGLQFANGIAFGPDGLLYVDETYTGDVYRYRIEEGAAVGDRELFGNVLDLDHEGSGLQGPDGMAFSADGRLWVAVLGQGDITVLAPDGSVDRRIKLPGHWPTNVAFGPPGDGRIYIVEDERGSLEARVVGVEGLALHS
ncbi:MAG: SMP-30/gluconolactonase/LRE family protein [Solirubrobacteraceae bacterium]